MTAGQFSTRFTRKGALIDESRAVFERWDESLTTAENVSSSLQDHVIAAKTEGWRSELRTSLTSRLSKLTEFEVASLAALAKSGCGRDCWLACLHWHFARLDRLYFDFVTGWLFEAYQRGVHRLRTEDIRPFVDSAIARFRKGGQPLTEYGAVRAARDMLRMASDFGLMVGTPYKEFASFHLPEESFIYLLHAMIQEETNARRVIDSPDWHMFLMDASDVERELLRLHQFHSLHFQSAGSLAQLKLPYRSPIEYVRELRA